MNASGILHVVKQMIEGMSSTFERYSPVQDSLTLAALITLTVLGTMSTPAHAATVESAAPTNIHYTSVLDYSPTDALITLNSIGASSTYDCVLATGSCSASTGKNLAPIDINSGSGNYVSPDQAYAITTTRVPLLGASFTLSRIENGALTKIAAIPFAHEISRVLWSSDDRVLILMSMDGSVARYEIPSGTLRPITNLPGNASWLTLSPNGRYLAYYLYATASSPVRTYGVLDTLLDESHEVTEPLAYWDVLTEGVQLFAFSPDSTKLVYLSERDNFPTLYQVNLSKLAIASTMQGTRLISKPYTISDFQWISNSTLLIAANRDNPSSYGLFTFTPASGALAKVADGVSFNSAMQKIGGAILFSTADQNGRFPKLFHIGTGAVSAFSIPGVSQNAPASGNTSVTVDGVPGVYLAPHASTDTLLVWLHGGPDRTTALDYNSYMSYGGYDLVLAKLQAAGTAVLKLDYPGSIGHGRDYAESIKGSVGTVDVARSEAAIRDFAATHGYTKVYLMGNSYGGYLGLKLLATYPNEFRGMLSLSGVTDWESLMKAIPSSIFGVDFNGAPNAMNQPLYDAASIVKNLGSLSDQKVTLIQGDQDSEVPYSQSVLLDSALTAAGKAHSFITLPGEDHVYAQPSSYSTVCTQAFLLIGTPDQGMCVVQ